MEYDPNTRIDWSDIMRHTIMKDTIMDEMMDLEISNTFSCEIVNPYRKILEEVFKNFESLKALEHTVFQKLLMTHKKVVVIENIFIDFVDNWLRKFLKDDKDTEYYHRKCLAPLLGHLAVYIKDIICFIIDKEKSIY
jgi:hypothetical protein